MTTRAPARWALLLALGVVGCGRVAPGLSDIPRFTPTYTNAPGAAAPANTAPAGTPAWAPLCQKEQYRDGNMIYERCK
jgi:hypothetical protein